MLLHSLPDLRQVMLMFDPRLRGQGRILFRPTRTAGVHATCMPCLDLNQSCSINNISRLRAAHCCVVLAGNGGIRETFILDA